MNKHQQRVLSIKIEEHTLLGLLELFDLVHALLEVRLYLDINLILFPL